MGIGGPLSAGFYGVWRLRKREGTSRGVLCLWFRVAWGGSVWHSGSFLLYAE